MVILIMKTKGLKSAFTLIEILVVIAILAIIAVVVFVALNPAQRFADARDSRRVNDVNSLLTAIHECIVDNDGDVSACTNAAPTDTPLEIVFDADGTGVGVSPAAGCNAVCGVAAADDCVIFAQETAPVYTTLQTYLKSIPVDPQETAAGHTSYMFEVDANNLVTVSACRAEGGVIEASR